MVVRFQRAGAGAGDSERVGISRLQSIHEGRPEHEELAVSVSIPGLGSERGLGLAPAGAGKPCAVRCAAKEKDRRIRRGGVMKFEDRVPRASVGIGNEQRAHGHSGAKGHGERRGTW